MRWTTVPVFALSAVVLGLGIDIAEYADNTKALDELGKNRPMCAKLVPYDVRQAGVTSVVAALLGVPTYYGRALRDKGVLLEVLSVVTLYSMVMAASSWHLCHTINQAEKRREETSFMDELANVYNRPTNKQFNETYWIVNITTLIDATQAVNRCCGTRGPHGWTRNGRPIPASCCRVAGCDVENPAEMFQEGCYPFLRQIKDEYQGIFVIVDADVKKLSSKIYVLMAFVVLQYAVIFFCRIWPR